MKGEDDKVYREVWKTAEAKIGKIGVAKTKRRRKGKKRKEMRRKKAEEEERKKKEKAKKEGQWK